MSGAALPHRARSGEFDAARQILIDNKVHAGAPAIDVVTPLKLADGERYVLVDRGWVAHGARRAEPPAIPLLRARSRSAAA